MKEQFNNELTTAKGRFFGRDCGPSEAYRYFKGRVGIGAHTTEQREQDLVRPGRKLEATAHADAITKQIAAEENQLKQAQAAQAAEIGTVKESANAANAKIADVSRMSAA
ncbi:MAG: hypothetical protein WDO73_25180 [Ignavibacteriota bacterium]